MNSTSASSAKNLIANSNSSLTILQVLVGFNKPDGTQRKKTLRNDLRLSKVRVLSGKII